MSSYKEPHIKTVTSHELHAEMCISDVCISKSMHDVAIGSSLVFLILIICLTSFSFMLWDLRNIMEVD